MSSDTTSVDLPTGLVEEVDECAEERGFDSKEQFIQMVVRDAVNAKPDLTEQARKDLEEADERDTGFMSIEEAWDELDVDQTRIDPE